MKVSEGVRRTHHEDGGVLLDIRHGQMFRVNPLGSKILEMLERACTEAQIVDEISREFKMNRGVIQSDVREFLSALEKHHLVEVHGGRESP